MNFLCVIHMYIFVSKWPFFSRPLNSTGRPWPQVEIAISCIQQQTMEVAAYTKRTFFLSVICILCYRSSIKGGSLSGRCKLKNLWYIRGFCLYYTICKLKIWESVTQWFGCFWSFMFPDGILRWFSTFFHEFIQLIFNIFIIFCIRWNWPWKPYKSMLETRYLKHKNYAINQLDNYALCILSPNIK